MTLPSRRWILGAAASALAAPSVLGQAPIVMKVGTATSGDAQHEYLKRFAAALGRETAGRIAVEVYPAAQLGSVPRMLEGVQLGSIQGVSLATDFLTVIDERFEAVSAPGLFRSMDHAFRALREPAFASAYLAMGQAKGIRPLALFLSGPLVFNLRAPLSGLDDLAGRKIRVLSSRLQIEQVRRLGGTPVPMALGDVLPALQQGTLDGTMNNMGVLTPLRYYETAPTILETNHAMISSAFVLGRAWLDGLAPDLQQKVTATADAEAIRIHTYGVEFTESMRRRWTEGGGRLVAPSSADAERLRREFHDLGETVYAGKAGPLAMYRLIADAAARTT
jgi:TRAP-type transport system periplasmic protein